MNPAWTEEAQKYERRVGLAGIVCSEIQETGISNKGKSKGKKPSKLNRLSELPTKMWEFSPHDGSGIQFHSRFRLGMAKVNMMLDSGCGVNPTTEEEVLHLINLHSQAGISMSNPKHPVRRLEKWTHTQTLSGIAAGEPIKLIGAVVLRVTFLEVGRNERHTVNIRFKITPKGSTGWVKWIIGARALDCDERGGLAV